MNAAAIIESSKKAGFINRLHNWFKDEHAVGLDISDGHIAAAHFARRKGELELNALATEKIASGLSPKEQAQCLHAFWRQNRFPTRTVCTSLHSSALIVRSFSYTNVLENELKSVLTMEAEEALQLPAGEVSFSWQINPPSGKKNELSGTLIAVPRSVVQNHVKMIQMAGLYPVNVEISCSAMINLYAFTHPERTEPVCLVSLSGPMAGIVILSNGFTWPRIVISGSQSGWVDNARYLADSIESALIHFQLKLKGMPVGRLLLSGGGRSEELAERLGEKIKLPIDIWYPLHDGTLRFSKQFQKKEQPRTAGSPNLSVALGLGLHHPKNEI